MNLLLRLLWLLLTARRRPPTSVLGPCNSEFRVLPNDLDVLLHMNNGRYFSVMDLARVDLMVRAGLWPQLRARGWYPVVVRETMEFRRSLKLFDSYTVRTAVVAWDEKHILLSQLFVKGEVEMASALVKARFLKKSGGSVATAELLALTGITQPSQVLPDAVQSWWR